jgi:Domain of unknown function (DUF4388)
MTLRTSKSEHSSRRSTEEGAALDYLPGRDDERTRELERAGFSGTCETTLTDWIQLVQMARRDAVIRVITHDGSKVTLWCRGGDIIDAASDGLSGADAVYQALSWDGGRISVDFGAAFQRQRQIGVATTALLLEAAHRRDSGSYDVVEPRRLPDDQSATEAEDELTNPQTDPEGDAAAGPLRLSDGGGRRRSRSLLFGGAIALLGGLVGLLLVLAPVKNTGLAARPPIEPHETPAPARRVAEASAHTSVAVGERTAAEVVYFLSPLPPSARQPASTQPSEAAPAAVTPGPSRSVEGPVRARRVARRATGSSGASPLAKAKATAGLRDGARERTPAEPRVKILEGQLPRIQLVDELAPVEPRIEGIE